MAPAVPPADFAIAAAATTGRLTVIGGRRGVALAAHGVDRVRALGGPGGQGDRGGGRSARGDRRRRQRARERRARGAVELEGHGLAGGVAGQRRGHRRRQACHRRRGRDAETRGLNGDRGARGALAPQPRVQQRRDGVGPGSGRDRGLGAGEGGDRPRAARADRLGHARGVVALDRVAVDALAQQGAAAPAHGDAVPRGADRGRRAGRHRRGLRLRSRRAGARPGGVRRARAYAGGEDDGEQPARQPPHGRPSRVAEKESGTLAPSHESGAVASIRTDA